MKIRRPWWLAVIPATGAIALVLGYVGLRELPGAGMTRADALLSAIQLFVMEGSISGPGTPLALNVARYLAPATLAYATALAVAAVFWEQFQYFWISRFARQHLLVVGFSSGIALPVRPPRHRKARTVVLVPERATERTGVARSAGATVVTGDASDFAVLRRLRAPEAGHVIVATGNDVTNLEVLAQLKDLTARIGGRPVVHIEVEDEDLWTELGRLALHGSTDTPVIEFFNRHDRNALALVDAAERLSVNDRGRVHIEGDGPLAKRLLVHLIRRASLAGSEAHVCLGGSHGTDLLGSLVQRDPWMADVATLEVCSDHAPGARGVAFVCVSRSDAAGIGRALNLAASGSFEAVLIAVSNHQVQTVLGTAVQDERITAVSGELLIDADFLDDSAREVMARARHDDYLAQETNKGSTAEQNPSLVPWADLPDALKESNRNFADSVGRVVGGLGGQLAPLRALDGEGGVFENQELIERLAVAEHERWAADLRRDGWRYGAGPKDPIGRTHPLLVPWDDLDEAERQKDRDAIRAIPRMLARVGYGVVVPPVG